MPKNKQSGSSIPASRPTLLRKGAISLRGPCHLGHGWSIFFASAICLPNLGLLPLTAPFSKRLSTAELIFGDEQLGFKTDKVVLFLVEMGAQPLRPDTFGLSFLSYECHDQKCSAPSYESTTSYEPSTPGS